MIRQAITTCIAAAIALVGVTTAPAHADQDDVAKAFAALLGIAIIGKIIHDRKDRDDDVVTRRRPDDRVLRPHRRVDPIHPRPLPRRVDRKLLPQECFRSFDTYQGPAYMFGRDCLQKHYAFANRLPRECRQRIKTYRGNRIGYEARCLRDNGYQLARN